MNRDRMRLLLTHPRNGRSMPLKLSRKIDKLLKVQSMSKASCVRGKKILDFFLFPNREKKKKELFPLGMSFEFAAIVSQTAGVGVWVS